MHQQRLADTLAAQRGANEQIFQIDSGAAAEGREIDEPDREAYRLAVPFGDLAEQSWIGAEQRRIDVGLRRLHFVKQLFVFGEFANKGQHESRFALLRTADREGHQVLTPRLLIRQPRP